ncbi:glycoside hydrolase family 28 protein [Laetiporus sulphureus 93-53]|uniref:endo-polygalacturonase n=1 Tax=Laetiporus sulphureus 93-53 TaxID=1314785 RepID=A0A165EIT7_9APHY|nr:glycoside hydrolase family 28 protein [Laetiporus sulphureus 93-53]KZT07138.1 glycoside hydrolase family 28 protein [Laetiporus sulphureus 93-53]
MMFSASSTLTAIFIAPLVLGRPSGIETAKRSTCTVDSVDSASDLSDCSDVVISSFTVPDGETVTMSFAEGATVTMTGEVAFANTTADGPLITFEGTGIAFDGGGNAFNGNGADYWDGQGTNGGVPKPHPFMRIEASGTFSNFVVFNSPAQAISVEASATLVIDSVFVNNSAGDIDDLGHNTDGFDVSMSDLTIINCVVENQDDCIAINDGANILFQNNTCSGGHGMSIGSIASGKTVSNVSFIDNAVSNSMYGTRIKVDADATSGSVSGVTWSGNTISGITYYGVLITQSYPDNDGTPGNDTTITDVNFVGSPTTVTVDAGAYRVTVDCGNCSGTWDWSELTATGGDAGTIASDDATIEGGSY